MAPFDMHGALGGLQGGYNWQFNRSWLVGIEADYDWARIRGTGTSAFVLAKLPSTFLVTQNITSFGTVRGRIGWVALPSLLVYGTGGFAYGRVGETEAVIGGGSQATVVPAVGTGLEYALWEHWTIRAEYLYVNLGSGNAVGMPATLGGFAGLPPSSFTSANSQVDFHVIRAGLNWKF